MKKLTFLGLCLLLGKASFAQTVYVDVLTAPAMVAYAEAIKEQQKKTNDNLTAIERGQLLVMGQLQVANDLQDKILKGLTQVSQTVNNAMTIKEIYQTSTDIIAETQEAAKIAASNPALVIFATQSANEFKRRALALTTEVSRVLTGGESNMMDAGERQKLLNYIWTEIRLMYACAYGVKHSMYWARQNGFWRSLNPFAAWVNQDVGIMRDVINRAKTM